MVNLGPVVQDEQQAVSSETGIYRAAFPAFRVFIYGQEVSGDVIDVRVNHSGGSMDRSPSTCAITLYNPQDKYIMDHSDMIALSDSRQQLVSYLDENVASYLLAMSKDELGLSGEDASDVKTFFQLLGSAGRFEDLSTEIGQFYTDLKEKSGYHQEYWEEGKTPDAIKLDVIGQKAPLTTQFDTFEVDDPEASGVGFVYPFTEGDCIFHPNDPIRIAFRDPFHPTVWYWMFSGFMDGFTEDVGANQESAVTIVGTDVSKVLRYSFMQLNTNAGLDKGLSELFPGDPIFSGTTSELKWVAYEKLFAHFTIFEILEVLFFGKESLEGSLTELTYRAINKMTDEETNVFLQKANTNLNVKQIQDMSRTKREEFLKEYLVGTKQNRFEGAFFPPVYTPQGVTFNRRDSSYGTYAFFVGDEIDEYDKALGTWIQMDNLRQLNDLLHHRVRSSDLTVMKNSTLPQQTLLEELFFSTEDASIMGLMDVITKIGGDIENYPVGAGRVFYVAPATLSLGLSTGVMNEMVGGSNGGLHSEFKDRLTYLYDVAEQIQFCCYATPRGDMVFEMPFYDFDPWHFDRDGAHISNRRIEESAGELRKNYEDMRSRVTEWAAGTSTYSEEDIYEMMDLASDLQLTEEGLDVGALLDEAGFRYSEYFTINKHETMGFSNSLSDSGLKTFARSAPHNIARFGEEVNDINTRNYEWVTAPGLAPTLGARPAADKDPWTEVTTEEAARFFASVELRKANAEARNLGLQTLPHFGLMVNRPLYWRQRNYVANIVSCQHSISVNSSCDTTINLNLARGWTGEYQKGSNMERFQHFGGETPFNYADLLAANRRN